MYRITERQNAKNVVIRVIVNLEHHEISFALIPVTGTILNKHICNIKCICLCAPL